MIRKLVAPTLLLALGLALPGSSEVAQAQKKKLIRIAMLAPRGSVIHREFKKLDKELEKATGGAWGARVYPSGMAGDDKDVIRKMRVGQMDAAIVTTTGLSQIVRQVAVLDAPGVINGYRELELVQDEMNKEWEGMFLKNKIKLLSWWEAGRYRMFSKGPVRDLKEMRQHRAWVWPDSYVLKELWRAAGVTGVPLGVPDVFGALQTGMVDLVVNTPVALVALRWHLKLDHMTKTSAGVLLLSWIINKNTWEEIPQAGKDQIIKNVNDNRARARRDARKEDAVAYKRLVKRGYTVTKQTPAQTKEWDKVQAEVRKRLTGRVYPASLLKRVQSIAAKARKK